MVKRPRPRGSRRPGFSTYEKEKDSNGNPTTKDAEYYSYTGSAIMLDQAEKDFSKEDLPCPTVVMEQVNKLNKKFYKFT